MESAPATGSKLLHYSRTLVTHFGNRKQWFVGARSRLPAGVSLDAGSSTFGTSHLGQVSIAKVLLGVFGLAVVVVLITVPTVIFLNGESDIPSFFCLSKMKASGETRTQASLRTSGCKVHFNRIFLAMCCICFIT